MVMEDELKHKISVIKDWLGTGAINIFGLPFSGKDTHGAELASFLEGPLIGGGDILRNSSQAPKHVLDAIHQGNLAPSEEYKRIVLPYLQQEKYSGKPLVLSSVGRWIGEERSVLEACEQAGHPIRAVIFLNIPQEEVFRRWQENKRERHDDASTHILENRLEEFAHKTVPVLEEYEKIGLLIALDATPAIPLVTAAIIERLHERAQKSA
jgi:adenylate kinase family enzyme